MNPTIDDLYRVGRVEVVGDCHVWRRRVRPYGIMPGIAGAQMGEVRAHRVAVILDGRTIPPGMNVLHTCDNPPCVNPAHLYVGTQKDNSCDAWSRGRGRNQFPPGGTLPPVRVCPVCGSSFTKSTQTCSRSCGARLTWVTTPVRKMRRREWRECLVCGKRSEKMPCDTTRTCSRACGLVLNHRNRGVPLDQRPGPLVVTP